jgi:hypothetical protein
MPDLSSLREEIQNPEYLSLSFQPETLQVTEFKFMFIQSQA